MDEVSGTVTIPLTPRGKRAWDYPARELLGYGQPMVQLPVLVPCRKGCGAFRSRFSGPDGPADYAAALELRGEHEKSCRGALVPAGAF